MKSKGTTSPAGGSGCGNNKFGSAPSRMGDSNLPKGKMVPGHTGGPRQGSKGK